MKKLVKSRASIEASGGVFDHFTQDGHLAYRMPNGGILNVSKFKDHPSITKKSRFLVERRSLAHNEKVAKDTIYDKAKVVIPNKSAKVEVPVSFTIPDGIIVEKKSVTDYKNPSNNKYGVVFKKKVYQLIFTANQSIRVHKELENFLINVNISKEMINRKAFFKLYNNADTLHKKMLRDFPFYIKIFNEFLSFMQNEVDLGHGDELVCFDLENFNKCLNLVKEEDDLHNSIGTKYWLE